MKTVLAVILAALVAGCTSMQTKAPTDELRQQIRAGGLVEPGDRIRVTMSDGTRQAMEVFRVDEDALHGHTADGVLVEAEIDDIAVLATEELSIMRSAGLGIGLFYGGIFALGALGILLYGV